jgi:uncharacterized protein
MSSSARTGAARVSPARQIRRLSYGIGGSGGTQVMPSALRTDGSEPAASATPTPCFANATWTIVGSTPVSRTYHSRDEFFGQTIEPFNARLSTPLVPTVHALYADGDTVIAYFGASATAKDGKPYQNTYAWYLDLDGNRVTNVVAFFDSIKFNDFWNRITPA